MTRVKTRCFYVQTFPLQAALFEIQRLTLCDMKNGSAAVFIKFTISTGPAPAYFILSASWKSMREAFCLSAYRSLLIRIA